MMTMAMRTTTMPHDHHDDHAADYTRRIDNSFTDDQGATIGASLFFDNGFAGLSFGRLERDYGLPGHSHGGRRARRRA